MIRSLALAALAVAACGRSQGVKDQDLGGLVVADKAEDKPIDVDRATKDPDELGRALMRPFRAELVAMGPHAVSTKTRMVVEENGVVTDDLSDQATLEVGDQNTWHGTYANAKDYGREGTFVGGTLYLRPRYQRWHERAPETPDEPGQLRDAFADGLAANWDLLAPAVELTDLGAVTVAGRAGRKIEIKQAPSPRPNPPEKLTQRQWRAGRAIDQVAGQVVLDAETGAPLSVQLSGAVSFAREGRHFTMKLSAEREVTAVGTAAIAVPDKAEVVATPERAREVDDRDFLLDGIAPPQKRQGSGAAGSGEKK